jgi:hypothetical protein
MSPNVCSLELSKKLAEAYPKAETELWWFDFDKPECTTLAYQIEENPEIECLKSFMFPAFQIHELLQLLPWAISYAEYRLEILKLKESDYSVGYTAHWNDERNDDMIRLSDVSLVEALGKLALWVKENGK